MFFATYKNTFKTLLRSAIIWLCVVLVLFLVFERAVKVNYGYTIVEDGKILGQVVDTDPEFELSYENYIQLTMNAMRNWVMYYALPLFCVVTTMVVLSGDFRNGLFEIEKANGVKATKYFFGRLTALLSINIVLCLLCSFSSICYYYFSRGGVDGYHIISFIQTTVINVFRTFLGAMFPAILFFIGLTYVSISLLKSGLAGAVIGFGYVLFEYATKTHLTLRMPSVYHDYLTPKPNKLYYYWGYYDNPEIAASIPELFEKNQVVLCTAIILIASLLIFAISYLCLRKREI